MGSNDARLAAKRIIIYLGVGIGLTLAYGYLRGTPWQGSGALHTVMEALATLLAFIVGVMALVRYYSRKETVFLIVGVGFLGTGFLDGYHATVTSAFFRPYMPSDMPALIPWSWVASRQFLSIMMAFSWYVSWREAALGVRVNYSERKIYLSTIIFTLLSFAFFAFYPLPQAYYPDIIFHRPEEFAPALFFLIALAGYLKKGNWKENVFEHWLVLSLIVGFLSQAVFMSFSGQLFDLEFDAAHTLKKVSYICVLTGLLLSMYSSFIHEGEMFNELTQNEELLQMALDNLPGGLVVTDKDLRIVISSNQFAEIYHVPPELLKPGKDYRDFLWHLARSGYYGEGDLELLVEKRVASILDPGDQRFEDHRPDGGIFSVRRNKVDGGRTITIVSDITELKHQQHDLRESEGRLKAINDTVPAGIIVARIDTGEIIFANREAQMALGANVGEKFGGNWDDIFADSEDKEKLLVRFSNDGLVKNQEMRIRRSDGSNAWIYLSLTGVPSDEETMLLMSFVEITERKLAERELEISEARFRDFGESSSDWYWEMDENLRFTFFSDRFTLVTGVDPELLLGKTRQESGNPGISHEDWLKHLGTLSAHEAFRNFVHPREDQDGTVHWLSINGRPTFNSEGTFRGYRGTGLNITDTVMVEQELKLAKEEAEAANEAKSTFLASMSHEIRTPMAGVVGFADMLLEDPIAEDSREKVFRIKESMYILLTLLNEILDLSKLEAGKMELEYVDFHLPALIDEAAGLLEHKVSDGKVNFTTSLSEDFPTGINADPSRIRQVILNLIGNAVKFTELGSITLEGSLDQAANGQHLIRIAIHDTGIGMTPESIDKLFKDFTQADSSISRRFQGTGLGLSICKRLVELMGGEIGAESELHKGSTFWFTLPYTPARSEIQAPSTARQRSLTHYMAKRPLHILVVDDNALNQRIILATVESFGHTCEVAKDGMQAIEKHESGSYDLILMDVRMPVLSGPDATELIRQMDEDKAAVPIIALTADAMVDHKRVYLKAGMDAVVGKPIDREVLAKTMNTVLDEDIHISVEVDFQEPASPAAVPESQDDKADADIEALLKRMSDITEKPAE